MPLPATNSGFEMRFLSNARLTFMMSTWSSSTSRMFSAFST